MSGRLVDDVWKRLYGTLGADLLLVARYEGLDSELRRRDEASTALSPGETRSLTDAAVIYQLSTADLGDAFRAGEHEVSAKRFADAWVLVCPSPSSEKVGLVAVARRGDDATTAAVGSCLDYLAEEVREQLA